MSQTPVSGRKTKVCLEHHETVTGSTGEIRAGLCTLTSAEQRFYKTLTKLGNSPPIPKVCSLPADNAGGLRVTLTLDTKRSTAPWPVVVRYLLKRLLRVYRVRVTTVLVEPLDE